LSDYENDKDQNRAKYAITCMHVSFVIFEFNSCPKVYFFRRLGSLNISLNISFKNKLLNISFLTLDNIGISTSASLKEKFYYTMFLFLQSCTV
jgi:hypothetical protein